MSEWSRVNQYNDLIDPMSVYSYTGIPLGLMQESFSAEISGIYGSKLLQDLGRIIKYYQVYEDGADFAAEGHGSDYVPSDVRYMKCANLIDKQARFMFGKPAEFILNPSDPEDDSETTLSAISDMQNLIDNVLSNNAFAEKCLKGFKDACIGERVAITLDFNAKGVFIRFLPSYSFIHEYDEYGELTKLITFYTSVDSQNKLEQRIYRKRWSMDNSRGLCQISEEVFDGNGSLVDTITKPFYSKFTYIPATVIINDGLTGDEQGVSEIKRLISYEEAYSKMANADIDSGRQNMNPTRYTIDMTPESTKKENLSIAAGSYWDLTSDKTAYDGTNGQVGVLTTPMTYSEPLGKTLDRLATTMNDTVDVPNINADSMTGVITSGKSLKAIYWPLIVRCDEKMIAWKPALEFVVKTILDGIELYPESASRYVESRLSLIPYMVTVENPYSLPEDDTEEQQNDIMQVSASAMSRKTFIQKWQGKTSKEADQELQQIAFERALFEGSYTQSMVAAAGGVVPSVTREASEM